MLVVFLSKLERLTPILGHRDVAWRAAHRNAPGNSPVTDEVRARRLLTLTNRG
ncbi:hypothetical protein [Leucobacter chromiireducens]|uniref:hypothetical protein n=1 Tax=Leucobacter chromiireducens TaxID=283877 RepID=UPI0013DE1947|nr:hypothetical protein [Leucobacter chromiireducens]